MYRTIDFSQMNKEEYSLDKGRASLQGLISSDDCFQFNQDDEAFATQRDNRVSDVYADDVVQTEPNNAFDYLTTDDG